MKLTAKQFDTLARLAKLDFGEDGAEDFAAEFEEFIAFADGVNCSVEGDTSTISGVGGASLPMESLRGDEVKPSYENEKVTSGVQAEGGYFPVGRVVK